MEPTYHPGDLLVARTGSPQGRRHRRLPPDRLRQCAGRPPDRRRGWRDRLGHEGHQQLVARPVEPHERRGRGNRPRPRPEPRRRDRRAAEPDLVGERVARWPLASCCGRTLTTTMTTTKASLQNEDRRAAPDRVCAPGVPAMNLFASRSRRIAASIGAAVVAAVRCGARGRQRGPADGVEQAPVCSQDTVAVHRRHHRGHGLQESGTSGRRGTGSGSWACRPRARASPIEITVYRASNGTTTMLATGTGTAAPGTVDIAVRRPTTVDASVAGVALLIGGWGVPTTWRRRRRPRRSRDQPSLVPERPVRDRRPARRSR